jgi:ferredoxin
VAFVRCGAGTGKAQDIFSYDGRRDCAAAAACFQGQRACISSCLGFGTCVRACPLGAIRLVGGLARVDPLLCTGCGICVEACPTKVVALVPAEAHWQVACNSKLGGEEKKKLCSVPCTGCGECERLSAAWEFRVRDNLAQASGQDAREGQGNWDYIAGHCPTQAITKDGLVLEPRKPEESKAKKP